MAFLESDRFSVGSYLHRCEYTDPEGVFGRDIAVETFFESLIRYGEACQYDLFDTVDSLSGKVNDHSKLKQIAGERPHATLTISDIEQLKREFDSFNFRVWHDAGGEMDSAAALRSNYSRRLYPITTTIHVLSYQGLLYGWFLRLLLQKIYPCDSLVCTSKAAALAIQKLLEHVAEKFRLTHNLDLSFKGRVDVIPLGVDVEVFRPRNKHEMRQELSLPQDVLLIAWIGRLSFCDKADLLPLLQVFESLVRKNPTEKLTLLLAGTGPKQIVEIIRSYSESLGVADRVILKDQLTPDIRHMVHAAADIFVSPADSIQETFGITPIEAMACGVPQVVSDWSGYRDTVKDGETGFLVPTCWARIDSDVSAGAGIYDEYNMGDHLLLSQATSVDPDGLEKALQTLIENRPLREQMSHNSRRRAVERFGWSNIIKSYENLWKELDESAAAMKMGVSPCRDYTVPEYVKTFGHYATRLLGDADFVEITDTGRGIYGGERSLPPLFNHMNFISEGMIFALLELFARSHSGLEVRAVETYLINKSGSSSETVRRHVMWLLKYGLLRFHKQKGA